MTLIYKVIFTAVLTLATGVPVATAAVPAAPTLKAGTFEPPRPAPELALRGSDGRDLTLARFRGKLVLMSFGFTH